MRSSFLLAGMAARRADGIGRILGPDSWPPQRPASRCSLRVKVASWNAAAARSVGFVVGSLDTISARVRHREGFARTATLPHPTRSASSISASSAGGRRCMGSHARSRGLGRAATLGAPMRAPPGQGQAMRSALSHRLGNVMIGWVSDNFDRTMQASSASRAKVG